MKKLISFIFFLFIVFGATAQSNKKLKKLFFEAKDSNQSNYVVLQTGEKKEIKNLTISSRIGSQKGKIEYKNGENEKFENGDIIQCQTNEAFYKLANYRGEKIDNNGSGSALASRMKKGAINVYFLQITYRVQFKNEYAGEIFYFIEVENNGNLIQLINDPKVVDMVEGFVMKSEKAKKSIAELRKAYGKVAIKFSTRSKLIEAVEHYNNDFATGNLTKE